MAAVGGINRLDIVIPLSASAQLATVRDECISKVSLALGSPPGDLWRYVDNSPVLAWGYQYETFVYNTNGILTVATVSLSGITHPPDGSDLLAVADPGVGTNTWTSVGGLPIIRTSNGNGGGGSLPAQNSGYNVWRIAGNSPTVVADFTAAITAVNASLSPFTTVKYFKYVDSVSAAWQVSALWFSPGFTGIVQGNYPNDNIFYIVTCSGCLHPQVGSAQPAVALPAFTQTFTSLSAPLNFSPQR
jgi:hypothetical protein